MKPFNLEEALRGAPVVTRDGREVKEIAHFPSINDRQRVFCVIDGMLERCCDSGVYAYEDRPHSKDLFMGPVVEVQYKNVYNKDRFILSLCAAPYKTVDEAMLGSTPDAIFVMKITNRDGQIHEAEVAHIYKK